MMNKTLKMGFLASAALAVFVSASSFAEEGTPPAATSASSETNPSVASSTKTTTKKTTTVASNSKRMKIKDAKDACLKDNPALKGKDLRKCVDEKRAQ